MPKILTPDKLTTEPNDTQAEKTYKHWKKTFENFIEECGDEAPDKLRCLTKYVSGQVYEYFSDADTYDAAIQILDKLFIRDRNDIFSRYQLATRKQQSTESLEEYI